METVTCNLKFSDMPIAYHGLAAYRGGKSGYSVFKKGQSLESLTGTICVADRPIGKIGVMVQGEIRFLFSGDCWSTAEERDNDAFDYYHDGFRTIGCNSAEFMDCLQDLRNSSTFGDYAEGWMRDPTIIGIWIAQDANEAQRKAARVIARRNHLFVRELEDGETL